jgi:hypothetical protein
VFAESAVTARGTIAGVVWHSIVDRQRDRIILVPPDDGMDAPAAVFDGFDVSVRKVVQASLVGHRTGQAADHRIVQSLRKVVWHIHHYPKGLDI